MIGDTCAPLCVPLRMALAEIRISYALVWGGSLLQCFSLFMLSLCKREQLYQVTRPSPSILSCFLSSFA
jgi:hypothetical protein